MATVAARFAALVDRTGAHYLWRGAVDRNGVPQMRVNGRLTTARRVAWELEYGPLDTGARVYACAEEPRCVRADHLCVAESSPSRPRVRRVRGEGSARQVRPGVWALTVTTSSHGRVFRTVEGDGCDIERQLARLAAEHGHPPATLDALAHLYIAHLAEAGRSATTVRRYEQLWRTWLAPSLGATQLDNLSARDVETALEAMADAGQSHRSVHQAAIVLNTTLAWARERGLVRANPVRGCELPSGATITGTRHR